MPTTALSLLVLAALSASAEISPPESISNTPIVGFLKDIQKHEPFRSVFILKKSNQPDKNDLIREISIALDVPVMLSSELGSFYVKGNFSSDLLVIVYVESLAEDDILYELWVDMDHMRFSKTVFLLDFPSKDDEVLATLFESCWTNRMINVLAVFGDFPTTLTYYRYTHIPEFIIEENSVVDGPPTDGYFPDRLRDLKRHKISIIFGGSEPKTIIWTNKRGETSIGGYAANFLLAVAKKHNANVSVMFKPESSANEIYLRYVATDIVDISSATTSAVSLYVLTHPYEYIDMCVMMPVEPKIPIYQIFMIVFQWQALLITIILIMILSALLESAVYLSGRKTTLLNYIIHDSCLRGALAQSFIEIPNASNKIRLIYLLICMIGIILVTSYVAFLQTYMYSPPSEKRVETLEDLRALGYKIYCLGSEFETLRIRAPDIMERYSDMFLLEADFAKFVKFRDSFNTSYTYLVNNVKWVVAQEQQRLLKNPLFRLDAEMCLTKRILMGFPINENSIYKNIVNFAILEAYSSGLFEFWQRKAFRELIEAGKLQFLRIVEKPESVPLKIDDLRLIWIGMFVASGLAIVCFMCEVFIFKWQTRRTGTRRPPVYTIPLASSATIIVLESSP